MSLTFIAGGIVFAAAVAIGGIASLKNIRGAQGPKERRYVMFVCALFWGGILSMLAFVFFLRPPLLYYVVGAYFLVMPVWFYRWAHRHQLIREVERREGEAAK